MHLPKFSFSLVLFSLIALIACEGDSGIDASLASQKNIMFDDMTLAKCDKFNRTDCPSGVALLLGGDLRTDKNPVRCSSFLVGKRILITNNHCIPDPVKQNPSTCKQLLTAVFPQTPLFAAERASCERIVELSDENLSSSSDERDLPAKRPDYAVIFLDRDVHRTFFPVSREGIPDNSKLAVYSFDPVPGRPGHAILKRKDCTSIQNTDLVPAYKDPFSPVASLKNCSIMSGNSGSAVVDKQNTVRAVLHATWPLDTEIETSESEISTTSAPEDPLAPFSVMTNAACIPLPAGFPPIALDCSLPRTQSINFEALYASAGNLQFDEAFRVFQQSSQSPFRFKKTQLFMNERTVTFPIISCVEKKSLIAILQPGEKDKTVYLNLPLWGPIKKVTNGYRYQAVPARIATLFTTVQFDPERLLKEKTTPAREVRSSFFTFMDNPLQLQLCDE